MAGLVVRDPLPVQIAEHDLPLGAKQSSLDRLGEIRHRDGGFALAGGAQGGLVDEVAQVGSHQPGRLTRDLVEVHIGSHRHVARVNLQDRGAAAGVGSLDRDPAVETTRAEQSRVKHVCPVGGGEHDHALARVEAVHLGEDLVERLLLLIVAPDPQSRGAAAADGIELVDEDDRRRCRACLCEKVTDARGAYTHDRLHEFRRCNAEERHLGLARDCAREQRLTGARRADQQHALGHVAAQALVLLGLAQKIDHLLELGLHLVDAGDVLECDRGPLGVVQPGPALAEGAEDAAGAGRRGPAGQIEESDH